MVGAATTVSIIDLASFNENIKFLVKAVNVYSKVPRVERLSKFNYARIPTGFEEHGLNSGAQATGKRVKLREMPWQVTCRTWQLARLGARTARARSQEQQSAQTCRLSQKKQSKLLSSKLAVSVLLESSY